MSPASKSLTVLVFAGSMALLAFVLLACISRSLQPSSAEINEALAVQEETIALLKGETAALREQLNNMEIDRDAQFARAVELTDEVHKLHGVENRMVSGPVLEVSRYRNKLGGGPGEGRPDEPVLLPKVRGKVTAVGEHGLVKLSLGSDDGLRAEHQLDVFRGTLYLGRVKILRAIHDDSTARTIAEVQRGPMEVGDDATTAHLR